MVWPLEPDRLAASPRGGLCAADRCRDLHCRPGRHPLEDRAGGPAPGAAAHGPGVRYGRERNHPPPPRPGHQPGHDLADPQRPQAALQACQAALVPGDQPGCRACAVAWYWQRGWIEQSFKDSKSRCFGLHKVQIATPARLSRLLIGLTIALCWLCLLGLPELGCLPPGWHAHIAQRGRASILTLALALLDHLHDLPAACLPNPPQVGMDERAPTHAAKAQRVRGRTLRSR